MIEAIRNILAWLLLSSDAPAFEKRHLYKKVCITSKASNNNNNNNHHHNNNVNNNNDNNNNINGAVLSLIQKVWNMKAEHVKALARTKHNSVSHMDDSRSAQPKIEDFVQPTKVFNFDSIRQFNMIAKCPCCNGNGNGRGIPRFESYKIYGKYPGTQITRHYCTCLVLILLAF